MATNPPPPEFAAPEPPAPDDQPQPNQWEAWQGAGIDPSYDPHQARQALGFWDALKDRNQREHAIEQLVRNDLLPEGVSLREAREILAANAQQDPWAELSPEEQYEPQQYQQPGMDPRAIQAAVDAQVQRQLAEHDERQQQQRQQEAYEQEFTREIERVGSAADFAPEEKLWLAAQANTIRQSQPYATTAQLVDQAGAQLTKIMNSRLQAMSQRQQETTAAPLPGGPTPSDQQVPTTREELEEAARRQFSN